MPALVLALMLAMPPVALSETVPVLVEAARANDTGMVRRVLQSPDEVDSALGDGTTALHWAAHWNNLEMADLLIGRGAGIDPVNVYGVTPLWLACTNNSDEMAARLLHAGADPGAATATGATVLMNCARTGAAHAVAAMLGRGADPEVKDFRSGQNALMWAAAGGHAEVVRVLIEHGADVSAISKGGFTPLMFAARAGDVASARLLLDAGADPDAATTEQGNALVVASASGHEELALLLVERGVDVGSRDANGITALHHAVREGLSALNGIRYDPVYRLRPANMPALAEALLEAGADPNARITRSQRLGPDAGAFAMTGATPLLLAAIAGDAGMMALLREFRADPGLTVAGGINLLMAAARAACAGSCVFQEGDSIKPADVEAALEAVAMAIDFGVDVNARNEEGQTAMHMAAFIGADAIVQYLADQGAEVNVKDRYGETPWSMASGLSPVLRYRGLYGSHESTAALLIKLGANPEAPDVIDFNALTPQ